MLQMGVPGGVELLVILLIALLLFGIPLVLVILAGLWLRSEGDDYEERIEELEAEIAALQAEVGTDAASAGTETTDTGTTSDEADPEDEP
jgi:sec-independent protein translocase protein TatA